MKLATILPLLNKTLQAYIREDIRQMTEAYGSFPEIGDETLKADLYESYFPKGIYLLAEVTLPRSYEEVLEYDDCEVDSGKLQKIERRDTNDTDPEAPFRIQWKIIHSAPLPADVVTALFACDKLSIRQAC